MGEEAKQKEAKLPEATPEEKPAEQKEEKLPEEKKEEAKPPSPTQPTVLLVDLHCAGCARKIERSILKCRGVEEVEMNTEKNEITVKGIVDSQALCSQIQNKTFKNVKVLSPLPKAESTAPDREQSTCLKTVDLMVNMHCEACAQQLRKKILKMRGVQSIEIDLNANKVRVIGTMNGEKLVEYIHRRTGKIARIISPSIKEEEEDGEKKGEEEKSSEEKKEEKTEEKKDEGSKEEKTEKSKKEAATSTTIMGVPSPMIVSNEDEMVKRMMHRNFTDGYMIEDEIAKRMMMMQYWMPMSTYVIDPPPMLMSTPPQIFSDENPNACCIS